MILNRLTLSNWKKGDKIICIKNSLYLNELTIGQEYVVIECFMEYGIEHVTLIGNYGIIAVFSSKFINVKRLRQEKLEKLEKLYEQVE
jgi:hypothetical protein